MLDGAECTRMDSNSRILSYNPHSICAIAAHRTPRQRSVVRPPINDQRTVSMTTDKKSAAIA